MIGMAVLGPNDPRALRHTGRTWSRDGMTGPIMVDGYGNEHEVVQGSVKDFTDPNSNFGKLMDKLAKKLAFDTIGPFKVRFKVDHTEKVQGQIVLHVPAGTETLCYADRLTTTVQDIAGTWQHDTWFVQQDGEWKHIGWHGFYTDPDDVLDYPDGKPAELAPHRKTVSVMDEVPRDDRPEWAQALQAKLLDEFDDEGHLK